MKVQNPKQRKWLSWYAWIFAQAQYRSKWKEHTYTLLKQGCSGSSPQCDSYSSEEPPSVNGPWLQIFFGGWKCLVKLLPRDLWWGGEGGCVVWSSHSSHSSVTSEVVWGSALLRGSTLVESRCGRSVGFFQREHEDKVRHFTTAVVFIYEYLSSVILASVQSDKRRQNDSFLISEGPDWPYTVMNWPTVSKGLCQD